MRDRAILMGAVTKQGPLWLEDNVITDIMQLMHEEGLIREPQSTAVGSHENHGYQRVPANEPMVQVLHGGDFRHWSVTSRGCSRGSPTPVYADSNGWGLRSPIRSQLRALLALPHEPLVFLQLNNQKQPGSWQCGYFVAAIAKEMADGATAEELANCNFDMDGIAAWLLLCMVSGRMTRCPQLAAPLARKDRIFPIRFTFNTTRRMIDTKMNSPRPPVEGL